MQDRQHRSIRHRIEKLIGMPGSRHWTGLSLAIPNNAGDDEVWIVERRTICVRERVAEFATFMDRARSLRRRMARDTAWKTELLKQALHADRVGRNKRINFGIGSLKPDISNEARPAMARSRNIDHIEIARFDHAIEVDVDEVEAGCRSPVAKQAGLDVSNGKRLPQKRIVEKVNLSD
jgi:hypothetical protein